MCNCGKNTCQNTCNCQKVCSIPCNNKCVVNTCKTNCYTECKTKCYSEVKTTCQCVRCVSKNLYQYSGGFGSTRGYSYGYQVKKCPDPCNPCKPKCCQICPVNCTDKYKWSPKKINCEEKQVCYDIKLGWNDCKPKKCRKAKSCSSKSNSSKSSSSSDSSKSEKKWCCKSCKNKHLKKHGKKH